MTLLLNLLRAERQAVQTALAQLAATKEFSIESEKTRNNTATRSV